MKFKTLVASIAFSVLGTALAGAADMPIKAAPPPPLLPPPFAWTGFYVGGNIGGAWTNNTWTDQFFGTNFNNNNDNGRFIGGGQVGVNWQVGQFVIGGEWDFDWASSNSNNNVGVIIPGVGNIVVANNNNRWITTVAARFGWAVDHWLFYGKVGGGWVDNNNFTITNLNTGASFTCGTFTTLTNCGDNTGGWLVGAGVEYAFANNWTVKAEYDYLGLGNRTVIVPAAAGFLVGDTFTTNNRNVQMFKVGFNYLFNWAGPYRY
jgi:outer membrane immunogenic protein